MKNKMKALIQRVKNASVTINGELYSSIDAGMLVLLGIEKSDTVENVEKLAQKLLNLRIFEDENGKMNFSIQDVSGEILVVSQFTLCGDVRHGRRPSFTEAAPPELAEALYEKFVSAVSAMGIRTATGRFRTEMVVSLENHGPVTILVDSKKLF